MNLRMGSQTFLNVEIPLLWGERAVLQDQQGRLSVIDLGGEKAKLEIVGDEPAPGVSFVPIIDGFEVLSETVDLYSYHKKEKMLTSITLGLPDCKVCPGEIRVGSSVFSGGTVIGFGVGIAVSKNAVAMGASLPKGLADLVF